MIKEDVKFAKEQYKVAMANYSRIKQKWHDANKHLMELQQEKAKIEHEVNIAKGVVSSAVALVADAKLDFQRKQAHWKELNKQYQLLCNQNSMIKKEEK